MQTEYLLDDRGNGQVFNRLELIHEEQSGWQSIEISDLEILGRVLALDGIIQLSELDKDRYHETMAHPAIQTSSRSSGSTAEILILGGGDGIIASEAVKYPGFGVTLVDIDARVVDLSRKHLSKMNNSALDSSCVKIKNQDALEFVTKEKSKKYDVIFLDITDPHPNSPSSSLLGDAAIKDYKRCLCPGGIIVAQTDNPFVTPSHLQQLEKVFENNFEHVDTFGISAMTFSGVFSFVWASDEHDDLIFSESIVETNWLTNERFNFCKKMLELV